MCGRFDGHALTLFFPSPPKSGGGTGLQNLLRGTKVIMTGRQPLHLLLLLDKEFTGSMSLQNACEGVGINAEVIEQRGIYIEANFTAHVYMAISGRTRNIEEDLSILIGQKYGDDADPTKDGIRNYLHSRGLELESMIEDTELRDLELAFQGLSRALHRIEENLGEIH